MDAAQKAFWEAVGAEGPVAIEGLVARIDDVLTEHPEFIRLDGLNTFILFSGSIMHGNSTQAAVDLVARANETIGIIYNTVAFEAMISFVMLVGKIRDLRIAAKGIIEARDVLKTEYGRYIKTQDSSNLVGQVTLEREAYKVYSCVSAHFAHHIKGNVITVTPDAVPYSVYAQFEVPHIGEGLRPNPETGFRWIKHVNGMDAGVFDVTLIKLPLFDGTPYRASEALLEGVGRDRVSAYERLRLEFDMSFKVSFRDAGGRVLAGVPSNGPEGGGAVTVLEADDWNKLGLGL